MSTNLMKLLPTSIPMVYVLCFIVPFYAVRGCGSTVRCVKFTFRSFR